MTTYNTVNGPATVNGAGGSDTLVHTHTVDGGIDLFFSGGDGTSGYSGEIDGSNPYNVDFTGIVNFSITDTGEGVDNIHTGAGADTLSGGAMDDILDGGGGVDVIDGGSGNDIWGGDKSFATQAIVVNLNAGLQTYLGSGSVQGCEGFSLTTGSGDDQLTGTNAAMYDLINTGGGNDRIVLPMALTDTVRGGTGFDTLVLTCSTDGGVNMTVGADTLSGGYTGFFDGTNPNNVVFESIEQFSFTDLAEGPDNIVTGDGNDTLNGGLGEDYLYGGRGSDVIDGGAGNDLWGGDKSFSSFALNIDLSQAGAQTYFGGGSVVNCEGFRLACGAGNDRLTGTSANVADSIDAGDGNDRIVLPQVNSDIVNGQGGRDALIVTHSFDGGVDMSVTGSLASGYTGMFDGLGASNMYFTGIEDIGFTDTGNGWDHITTGDGRDTLDGGAGDDILNSAGGVDVIDGGDGVDLWIADKSFSNVAFKINLTKPDAQTYLGTGSVSNIEGMRLKTGGGDDKLVLSAFNMADSIDAGAGDDKIALTQVGPDTINGGAGNDKLTVVNTFDSGVDMTVSGDLAGGYSGYCDGQGISDVVFTGIERFSFTDTGLGYDNILTGDGADTINSGDGSDYLRTAGGRDVIRAGAGFDVLNGGGGKDYLTGGGDGDRFVYTAVTDSVAGSQRDVITDFGKGDQIDLSAIDANTGLDLDQAFAFIGSQAFHGVAGELRAVQNSGVTVISGDVNGDGTADFQIELANGRAVSATDFVL